MSAKTTDMGPHIGHSSNCLVNRLFTDLHYFVNFINNLEIDFLHTGSITFLVYILCMMQSIVSLIAILVNKDSTSYEIHPRNHHYFQYF